MSGSNGKPKIPRRKKNGRPKAGSEVSKKLAKVSAIKHDGNAAAMAKDLGISPEAALKHLKKPEVKAVVHSARQIAIKKAGLSRNRAYAQMSRQMKATKAGEIITGKGKNKTVEVAMVPDWLEQDKARKDFLKIVGDYTDVQVQPITETPIIQMPVILIDNKQLIFNVGKEIIEDVQDV